MKYFFYTIVYIISFVTNAQDYIIESKSNNTILKTIIYSDGQEYIHIENSGLCKDNKGDYGNERCIGMIKKNKLNSNVKVIYKKNLLPLGLSDNIKIIKPIVKNSLISFDDVENNLNKEIIKAREYQFQLLEK